MLDVMEKNGKAISSGLLKEINFYKKVQSFQLGRDDKACKSYTTYENLERKNLTYTMLWGHLNQYVTNIKIY